MWFVIRLSLLLLGAGAATCFDDYVEEQLRVHRVRTVLKTSSMSQYNVAPCLLMLLICSLVWLHLYSQCCTTYFNVLHPHYTYRITGKFGGAFNLPLIVKLKTANLIKFSSGRNVIAVVATPETPN